MTADTVLYRVPHAKRSAMATMSAPADVDQDERHLIVGSREPGRDVTSPDAASRVRCAVIWSIVLSQAVLLPGGTPCGSDVVNGLGMSTAERRSITRLTGDNRMEIPMVRLHLERKPG